LGLGGIAGPDGHLSAELSWGKSEAEVGTSRVTLVCQNHGGITILYSVPESKTVEVNKC